MTGDVAILPKADQEFLLAKALPVDVVRTPAGIDVTFRDVPLPAHYNPRTADILIKLPAAYPAANPDMFWTKPDVRLVTGAYPTRADYHDPSANGWQRWSRHGAWRPGVDNLRTKFAAVIVELEMENK